MVLDVLLVGDLLVVDGLMVLVPNGLGHLLVLEELLVRVRKRFGIVKQLQIVRGGYVTMLSAFHCYPCAGPWR